MASLFDHVISLVELRTSFANEGRLAGMQMQYAELMTARDRLESNVQVGQVLERLLCC